MMMLDIEAAIMNGIASITFTHHKEGAICWMSYSTIYSITFDLVSSVHIGLKENYIIYQLVVLKSYYHVVANDRKQNTKIKTHFRWNFKIQWEPLLNRINLYLTDIKCTILQNNRYQFHSYFHWWIHVVFTNAIAYEFNHFFSKQ